jgi:hypothetical protein
MVEQRTGAGMGHKSDILARWYRQVWSQGDLAAIDTMFRPDTRASGILPGMEMGPDEFKTLVAAVLELIEPPQVTFLKTMEQDDWLAALLSIRARAVAQARPIHVTGTVFARFDGEFMVETYNNFDFIGFFEQLGLLPENSIALGLSGQRIGD